MLCTDSCAPDPATTSHGTKMNRHVKPLLVALTAGAVIAGCNNPSSSQATMSFASSTLAGAWRSKISFRTGSFAPVKDLEFLYAYNAGGTMTESSNYDEAANATPPAYGVWKQTGPGKFETKYLFYMTRPPDPRLGEPASGDWWPAGHGELTEMHCPPMARLIRQRSGLRPSTRRASQSPTAVVRALAPPHA